MIVPPDRIDPETLNRILEEYISREGTDYGEYELSMPDKCERLKRQLVKGEVLLCFDSETESLNILTAQEYQILGHEQ